MPTKNHGRMAQDMKRELIAIIGEMKDPRVNGGLLTVTRLDVTPDLDQAKVYISVMGREGGPDAPLPVRPGALRHNVPHWLHMPPLNAIVLQVRPAHRRHGGEGAYYVYLRR